MSYDERLAARVRELLASYPDLTEKRMFGGLAFLVAGKMAVAAVDRGGLMVRVDPEQMDRVVAAGDARAVEMRGRELRGWIEVDANALRSQPELARWVELGIARARSLPGKP